ncbi:MAG: hypothetical protein FWG32_05345 [Oscillospiraceae bacterium]|nr:hypothetical protein [Oscillospiraceae bacterium]
MFSSKCPPLLVLPTDPQTEAYFPADKGYCIHPLNESLKLVSYRDGWTLPLPAQEKKVTTEAPLLLVRNKGGVTSQSSTIIKGYAHQFVKDDGKAPVPLYKQAIFPDEPEDEWLLIPNTVNVVWLQYGFSNQPLGSDLAVDTEMCHYGKILILKLLTEEDRAPRLDKKAEYANMHDRQYRVRDMQLFSINWSLINRNVRQFIFEQLSVRDMEMYAPAVDVALSRAGLPD